MTELKRAGETQRRNLPSAIQRVLTKVFRNGISQCVHPLGAGGSQFAGTQRRSWSARGAIQTRRRSRDVRAARLELLSPTEFTTQLGTECVPRDASHGIGISFCLTAIQVLRQLGRQGRGCGLVEAVPQLADEGRYARRRSADRKRLRD